MITADMAGRVLITESQSPKLEAAFLFKAEHQFFKLSKFILTDDSIKKYNLVYSGTLFQGQPNDNIHVCVFSEKDKRALMLAFYQTQS